MPFDRFSSWPVGGRWGGGGCWDGTPDLKWRGWSKDFSGFEIFDSGIFWGRKIWQVFFWWLDLRGDFLGIQHNLKIGGSTRISRPLSSANKVRPNFFNFMWIFKARKFGMVFFGGYFLVHLGFVGSPRGFLGIWQEPIGSWFIFLPPFDHPRLEKSGVPPSDV